MEDERCENCRFWKKASKGCHRGPPTALVVRLMQAIANPDASTVTFPSVMIAQWSGVDPGEWCGEWKPVVEWPQKKVDP